MSEEIKVGDTVIVSDGGSRYNFAGLGAVTKVDKGYVYVRPICSIGAAGWDREFTFLHDRVKKAPPISEARSKSVWPDGTKPTNPKDAIGSDKLPLHLWPETATAMGCLGLLDGALKYGRGNWREIGIRASIYVDAIRRHLNAWFEGEECAPDSGVPHLAHALAGLAILVDAQAAGMLNDDRNLPGGYLELVEELTPHVPRLKELHAEKSPRHWTINDKEVSQ